MKNDFLHGKIMPALVRFAIPLMLSLFLQALYGAVDLIVVGQFGSTSSISAVAAGSQLLCCIYFFVLKKRNRREPLISSAAQE